MASITTISIYCQAGETYTIYIPATMVNNGGYAPRTGEVTLSNGKTRDLQMGFCLENDEVGIIAKAHEDKVAIDYKHKYPLENTIFFYSLTGQIGRILVANVPVHDHASIPTGGPAYGTYFSDFKDEGAK